LVQPDTVCSVLKIHAGFPKSRHRVIIDNFSLDPTGTFTITIRLIITQDAPPKNADAAAYDQELKGNIAGITAGSAGGNSRPEG